MDAQTIKSLVAIFLAAILTENYVPQQIPGHLSLFGGL